MKALQKDELYQNLQGFLKTKGVELSDGSYANKIQKSCGLLSEAINTSQQGLARAKVEIDKKLDQLRQVIHEKTAAPGYTTAAPKPETATPGQKPFKKKAEVKRPGARKKGQARRAGS
jgi:hypothetical protein